MSQLYLNRLEHRSRPSVISSEQPLPIMRGIYHAQCTTCGKAPEVSNGSADDPDGGRRLLEGYLAVKLDSGVFMYLPQGWDTQVLQEQGLTAMEAARQGRFFRVTFKICRQCGWMHEEPQICDPRAGGCLAAVIAAFIMLGILKFGMMLDWFSSLIGVWVGMLAVFGIVLLLRWARWHKQDAPLKLRNCLKCQAPDFVTVAKAAGKSLMCPHCHAQTMHYNRISRRT